MDNVAQLGTVTCPSGELVLLDAGCLARWSGLGVPVDLDGQWADAEIVGPDAVAAAQAFHRQSTAMLYDIPRHARDRYTGLFATLAGGLDATLRVLDGQVPHRERVRRAIAAGDPGFTMFGLPVATVGGVPKNRALPIYHRGGRLWVEVGGGPTVAVRDLGEVGVDSGHLAFADADALPRAAAIVEMGNRFLPTRLKLDASGAPCEIVLSVDAT